MGAWWEILKSGAVLPVAGLALLTGVGAAWLIVARGASRERSLLDRSLRLRENLIKLRGELEGLRRLASIGADVAGVAHTVKNAVHHLKGFASLLRAKVADRPEACALLEGLGETIEHLAEYSRLRLRQEGKQGLPIEALHRKGPEAVWWIQSAMREAKASFPAIRWTHLHRGDSPAVPLPGPVLKEVIVNLLRNAAESMGGQGAVVVQTFRTSANRFVIQVRDCGAGIARNAKGNLFRPGYTTKPDGNGLGLSISRTLLRQHGCDLSAVASESGGGLFQITLNTMEADSRGLPLASSRR